MGNMLVETGCFTGSTEALENLSSGTGCLRQEVGGKFFAGQQNLAQRDIQTRPDGPL